MLSCGEWDLVVTPWFKLLFRGFQNPPGPYLAYKHQLVCGHVRIFFGCLPSPKPNLPVFCLSKRNVPHKSPQKSGIFGELDVF